LISIDRENFTENPFSSPYKKGGGRVGVGMGANTSVIWVVNRGTFVNRTKISLSTKKEWGMGEGELWRVGRGEAGV